MTRVDLCRASTNFVRLDTGSRGGVSFRLAFLRSAARAGMGSGSAGRKWSDYGLPAWVDDGETRSEKPKPEREEMEKVLADAWDELDGEGTKKKTTTKKKLGHHKAPHAEFRMPTRLDEDDKKRQWREDQWDHEPAMQAVVRWVPCKTPGEFAEFKKVLEGFTHRFGAYRVAEIKDMRGRSLLWHAVDLGDMNCVEHLLHLGVAKNHNPTTEKWSPFLLAHQLEDRRMFSMLKNYMSPAVIEETLQEILKEESEKMLREKQHARHPGAVNFFDDVLRTVSCGACTCTGDDEATSGDWWAKSPLARADAAPEHFS